MPRQGEVNSNTNVMTTGALSTPNPSSAMNLNPTSDGTNVYAWTAAQNETVNLTSVLEAGQVLFLLISNDAVLPRAITLGTNLNSDLGTLVGTASLRAILCFVSDGVKYNEFSRRTGLGL